MVMPSSERVDKGRLEEARGGIDIFPRAELPSIPDSDGLFLSLHDEAQESNKGCKRSFESGNMDCGIVSRPTTGSSNNLLL